jgi:hypothetical protein
VREDGDALGCRVIRRLSRRESRRWKWLLKAMGMVKKKATSRNEI